MAFLLNDPSHVHDLINDIYKPCQKTNDNPEYINKNANHTTTILRQFLYQFTLFIKSIDRWKKIFSLFVTALSKVPDKK